MPALAPARLAGSAHHLALAAGLLLAMGCSGGGGARHARTGAYDTGEYPDLFVDLLGQTPEAVQGRVAAAWYQLFLGDDTQRIYQDLGDGTAYVFNYSADAADPTKVTVDVRSEGMSYGMMITLQLGKQAEFDRLWRWARANLQHTDPADPLYGYFAWLKVLSSNRGATGDPNPAPDGEEWFTTALLKADHRWGSGGDVDYRCGTRTFPAGATVTMPPCSTCSACWR